ncbi:MAG: BMP family ABC transporter substrate-binding protein [Ruminobacter sp.]|nr:BMP family ABC transporter substrate-binding protein [Ruminobacter sp.]
MRINWDLIFVLFSCLLTVSVVIFFIYDYEVDLGVDESNNQQARKSYKIMLLLPTNSKDGGWSESQYNAFNGAINSLNVTSEIYENVSGDDCINFIRSFVAKGGDAVIAPSENFSKCLRKGTKEFPSIKFIGIIDPDLYPAPNLVTFDTKGYQLRYLTGIVAAAYSKSDKFAFLVNDNKPRSVRDVNAYLLGLRSVNKNAEVYLVDLKGQASNEKEVNAMYTLNSLYPEIQVFTYNFTSNYIDEFCDLLYKKCISFHVSKRELFPNSNLTSIYWSLGSFYRIMISKIINNKFVPNEYFLPLKYQVIRLAEINKDVPFNVRNEVNRYLSSFVLHDEEIFIGPIFDNKGELRVPENGKFKKNDLLYNIDWYIDGVKEVEYEPN